MVTIELPDILCKYGMIDSWLLYNMQRDADDTLTTYIQKCKQKLFYGKTVVKLHLKFKVMNYGLLNPSLIVVTCTCVVLKNQCLIDLFSLITCFFLIPNSYPCF